MQREFYKRHSFCLSVSSITREIVN